PARASAGRLARAVVRGRCLVREAGRPLRGRRSALGAVGGQGPGAPGGTGVRIKGTCKRCGRDFLVDQVIGSGGRCPWDGQPFTADYALALVDALKAAQVFGTKLERALEEIADIHPAFTLDRDSV